MQRRFSLAKTISWPISATLLLALFIPLVAQESSTSSRHDKARELAKAGKLVEAEKVYREGDKLWGSDGGAPRMEWDLEWAALLTRMELFDDAAKRYNAVLNLVKAAPASQAVDPLAAFAQARAHSGLGQMHRAMELGGSAAKDFEESVRLLRALVNVHPSRTDFRQELAATLELCAMEQMKLARFRDAELSYREELQTWHKLVQNKQDSPLFREGLAVAYNSYGTLVRESGRYLAARDMIRSAIQVLEPLAEIYPSQPNHWRHLPAFYRNLGMAVENLHIHVEKEHANRGATRFEQKIAEMSGASNTWEGDGERILRRLRLRSSYRATDTNDNPEALHESATKLVGTEPIPAHQSQLVAAKLVLGTHWAAARQHSSAAEVYREALAMADTLVSSHPKNPKYRKLQAATHARIAVLQYLQGKKPEGEKEIQAAYALFRKLSADYPDDPTLRRAEDEEMDPLMRFMLEEGENDRVVAIMKSASEPLKKLCQDYPTCPQFRIYFATAPQSEGHMHIRMKNDKEAERAYGESVQRWLQVCADFPATVEFHINVCQAKSYLFQLYNRQKRWQEAETLAREILPAHQKLVDAAPKLACFHAAVGVDHAWLATLASEHKKFDQAVEHFNQSITLCEKAFALEPAERDYLVLLRESLRARGEAYQQAGNFSSYQRDLQRSRDLAEWLDTPFVRLVRIKQRIEEGKTDLARLEADDLFAGVELTGEQWFDLAGCYTLALNKNPAADKESDATRAVAALRKALDNGYRPYVVLAEYEQFRPLVTRADFQQLTTKR